MKQKILIVEDEVVLNDAYKLILESQGYEVTAVHNGKEALAKLEHFEPQLILLDLRMPYLTGVEFLEAYDLTKHPEVQVIVFSNLDAEDEVKRAKALGAQHYLLKAWASPRELVKIVNDTLHKK